MQATPSYASVLRCFESVYKIRFFFCTANTFVRAGVEISAEVQHYLKYSLFSGRFTQILQYSFRLTGKLIKSAIFFSKGASNFTVLVLLRLRYTALKFLCASTLNFFGSLFPLVNFDLYYKHNFTRLQKVDYDGIIWEIALPSVCFLFVSVLKCTIQSNSKFKNTFMEGCFFSV